MADLSVFILSYNERLHIERCVRAVQRVAEHVFVVDCGSSDGTAELAEGLGAVVVRHAWENNHARQINWAIDNLGFTTSWVMRVDADEVITPQLAAELERQLPSAPPDVNGFVVKRQQVFLGHRLRWGGSYPVCLLRVLRRGSGRCEERWMDEHLVLTSGRSVQLEHDLEDHNLNDLKWWTNKQANYAVREVADILLAREQADLAAGVMDPDRRRKRWLKERLYQRLPRFVGPGAYFGYRYVVRLGFLDGRAGLTWHVLQAFWYRFLVDALLYELELRARETGRPPLQLLAEQHGLRL
jgi:glycosyltransferase involved in cell wall biosynthesis